MCSASSSTVQSTAVFMRSRRKSRRLMSGLASCLSVREMSRSFDTDSRSLVACANSSASKTLAIARSMLTSRFATSSCAASSPTVSEEDFTSASNTAPNGASCVRRLSTVSILLTLGSSQVVGKICWEFSESFSPIHGEFVNLVTISGKIGNFGPKKSPTSGGSLPLG